MRAGYVLQGLWVPEFVQDYPEVLRQQHYEFARAGSDVTEAYQVRNKLTFFRNYSDFSGFCFLLLQYFTDRKRMNCVGLEDKTEQVNRTALRIAREVAEETGTLFAGGLSNVEYNTFLELEDPKSEMWPMYEEQARWCKEEGVDYIIAETLWGMTDAKIALEVRYPSRHDSSRAKHGEKRRSLSNHGRSACC